MLSVLKNNKNIIIVFMVYFLILIKTFMLIVETYELKVNYFFCIKSFSMFNLICFTMAMLLMTYSHVNVVYINSYLFNKCLNLYKISFNKLNGVLISTTSLLMISKHKMLASVIEFLILMGVFNIAWLVFNIMIVLFNLLLNQLGLNSLSIMGEEYLFGSHNYFYCLNLYIFGSMIIIFSFWNKDYFSYCSLINFFMIIPSSGVYKMATFNYYTILSNMLNCFFMDGVFKIPNNLFGVKKVELMDNMVYENLEGSEGSFMSLYIKKIFVIFLIIYMVLSTIIFMFMPFFIVVSVLPLFVYFICYGMSQMFMLSCLAWSMSFMQVLYLIHSNKLLNSELILLNFYKFFL